MYIINIHTVPNDVRSCSFLLIDDIVDESGFWTSTFLDAFADLFCSLPHTSAAVGPLFSSR